MPLDELIVLAIVQGITEFLPISSSGHLVLTRMIYHPGEPAMGDVNRIIDVAVHVGSLFAVLLYFRRETRDAVIGPFTLVGEVARGSALSAPSRLAILLIIATIPAIAFGLAIEYYDLLNISDQSAVALIGWTTLLFGILLYIGDRVGTGERKLEGWTVGSAIWMGLAQAIALIPGVSRSGVVMTAGRFLGYGRVEAARVAMVMAIPTILAAGGFKSLQMVLDGDMRVTQDAAIAAILSFLSAYVSLAIMMRMLVSVSFTPFVIYRLLLGGFLLWTAYANV